ncbi:MAG: dipeptidyl peptidase 3 [Bacteroidota bacterium]|nr:dipeptidyl peptidase 3 [Bacteroidota bacterium]
MINRIYLIIFAFIFIKCTPGTIDNVSIGSDQVKSDTFQVKVDQFADLQILRYRVPGFENLSPKEKELAYYLYEASLSGRDIIYDQNYKHNLAVRKTLEAILQNTSRDTTNTNYNNLLKYAKRFWFSNGIHHHYANDKFVPQFSQDYFKQLVKGLQEQQLPLAAGESKQQFIQKIMPVIFDPKVDAKKINLEEGKDLIASSANNYYEGVTQAEVAQYYQQLVDKNDTLPVMYGLNSKLLKEDGKLVEKMYKVGGMYSPAIERMVYWLEKAVAVSEDPNQKKSLSKLIQYYKTGDLKDFDAYNIAWVSDTAAVVDIIHGFIEVYGDALGYRGAYEAVLSIKDAEASQRMEALSKNAQWFESNSPILDEHKKTNVKGISYKVATVVVEAGDAAPSTPIGINLPNSDWIRKIHGSKSVSLGNISDAYNLAGSTGSLEEFTYNEEELNRAKEHKMLSDKLHTALHEVIGHASGQLNPGVASASETIKNYSSPLEEARADLVALYYIMDTKLVDIGVMPSLEVGKAEYDGYIRNGLMLQLNRLEPGANIEQAHMRNRQMVAAWAFEHGKSENVIERKFENGKTYFVVNDYEKLRKLFGELLREVQRIKSEGDFEGAKNLFETYGIKVDQKLLKEVKDRYAKLNVAPYSGFIQPRLVPVKQGDKIVDVKVEYPKGFVEQMLEYGSNYSFLPVYN